MLWQLHNPKYIRFKNIHFSLKKGFQFNIVSYKSFDPIWNHFHYYPWEKNQELTVSSRRPLDELTVSSQWPKCRAVSSPWSKYSPWQFVFLWDFHTDLVLHASSFAPFRTDFDHLVKKAICLKYKITRIDHINWKCNWFSVQLLHNLC